MNESYTKNVQEIIYTWRVAGVCAYNKNSRNLQVTGIWIQGVWFYFIFCNFIIYLAMESSTSLQFIVFTRSMNPLVIFICSIETCSRLDWKTNTIAQPTKLPTSWLKLVPRYLTSKTAVLPCQNLRRARYCLNFKGVGLLRCYYLLEAQSIYQTPSL